MTTIIEPVTDSFREKYLKQDFLAFFKSRVEDSASIQLGAFDLKTIVLLPPYVKLLLKVLNLTCWHCDGSPPKSMKKFKSLKEAHQFIASKSFKCQTCKRRTKFINDEKEGDEKRGIIYNNIRADGLVNSEGYYSSKKLYALVNLIKDINLIHYGLTSKFHPKHFFTHFFLSVQAQYISSNLVDADGVVQPNPNDVVKNTTIALYEELTSNSDIKDSDVQNMINIIYGIKRQDNATTYTKLTSGKYSIHSDLKSTQLVNATRSTIISGADIPFNTVKLPRRVQEDLGIMVKVTEQNIDMIKNLKLMNLLIRPPTSILVDSMVKRKLMDGDVVSLVRSPVIDAESVKAFRVIFTDDPTISFPIPSTSSYNADFDGDEVTAILFDHPKAYVETLKYYYIFNNLIRGGDGTSSIKLVLNTPLAVLDILESKEIDTDMIKYLLSKLNLQYDIPDIQNRMDEYYDLSDVHKGIFLISSIIPKSVIYTGKFIRIVNGIVTFYKSEIDGEYSNMKNIVNTILSIIIVNGTTEELDIFMENLRILVNEWLWLNPKVISITDSCHSYVSIRKNNAVSFALDHPKLRNNLFWSMAHGIKGNIDKARVLFYGLPVVSSNLTRVEHNHMPFSKRGEKNTGRYNIGSNLYEGLSLVELIYAFANSKYDVISSKKNTATSGHLSNQVRGSFSNITQDENGRFLQNGKVMSQETVSAFKPTSQAKVANDHIVTREIFTPKYTETIIDNEENDSQLLSDTEEEAEDDE